MAPVLRPQEPGDPALVPDELLRLRAARDAALEAAQGAIRDTTRLTRLLTILSEPAPLERLLDRALAALSELFSADVVVLLDPAGTGGFVPLAAIGLPDFMAREPLAATGHIAAAMGTRAPVLVQGASTDPEVDPHLRALGVESLVLLPVTGGQAAAAGVLILGRCLSTRFTHADADLLSAMAYRIGLALENARLYRTVREELGERVRAERELRESEERLKLALQGADLCMWDWDIPGNHMRLDEAWLTMLGLASEAAGLAPAKLGELVHQDDRPAALAALQAHLEGRSEHFEAEVRLRPATGRPLWVLVKGKVTHRDAAGAPLRLVGTLLDVSAAKQLEAERLLIEQQRQQLWRAESLSRMAGGIAHHFNNMLGAVMGNLELALYDLEPEGPAHERIVEAMTSARRAAEIGQLMLAYVGQTSGKRRLLDLGEAVTEALPLLVTAVPEHVRLTSELPVRTPKVLADAVHLKQILTNLVGNAVEAIGEAPGEIVLSISQVAARELAGRHTVPAGWTPRAERYACISVADTGCGLDPTVHEIVFEPFYSTKFAGRGLGLPAVLGLVRAHGGAVSVESWPGRGATFRVYLPVATEPAQPAAEDMPVPALAGVRGLVLLVDDEAMIRRVVKAQLERLGCEVVTAEDGVEAVNAFRARRHEYRLVLLDLAMPRMDGWATLAALRALRPDIPVVLASGYDEAQVMKGKHPQPPGGFLQKPYGLAELKAVLEGIAPKPS